MLTRRTILSVVALAFAVVSHSTQATAQFYGDGCSSCGQTAAIAPVANCTPIQPVYSTCYQRVPVTTMVQDKQTVEVPYYETSYEDRKVTVYRPVTTTREVEIPTVSYQNVTEYRQVNRDLGRWVTNYQPVCKMSPCQVDPRPGVIGFVFLTSQSLPRSTLLHYTTSRQYVPNMVACTVPTTRQVAIQGTRRVAVQETKMVAEVKTEKVAVQKLAYRKQEMTVMRPQTAYHTVPIGTSVAFAPGFGTQTAYYPYAGGAMTAFGVPVIDNTRTALGPTPDKISTKTSDGNMFDEDAPRSSLNDTGTSVHGSSYERTTPLPQTDSPGQTENLFDLGGPQADTRRPAPAIRLAATPVKATRSGWKAAGRRDHASKIAQSTAPSWNVSVAKVEQE
ncbi:MAG: hypothetical protein KDA96_19430 [Planctomycetaceae bacterium]|nr:hypothetical protein [Planctomycetaceae bacterium]